ncbi:MAG TPA: c-type cytochrome [Gemmatimonadales bacterium]
MRPVLVGLALVGLAQPLAAQGPGRFPPDSLINTLVIPHNTPVLQVIGSMRNFTSDLGVRCQFCHVGEEGMPLERFDFVKDEKRTKLVARQMMRMVQEINRRLDTLPPAPAGAVQGLTVTCATCHRGVSVPMPLADVISSIASASGGDSATRAYQALRTRYYGRASYDFGEGSLNTAAFRLGRAGKFDEALAILKLNETQYPGSSGMYVFRGNILLMKADTNGAAVAFREAVRRDSTNQEARGRLRTIGR